MSIYTFVELPCPPPTLCGTSIEDMRSWALYVCVLSCFGRALYISSQSQVRLQSPSISLIFTSTHGEREKRERNQLEPSPQIFQAPGCQSQAGTRVRGGGGYMGHKAQLSLLLSFCPLTPGSVLPQTRHLQTVEPLIPPWPVSAKVLTA